MIVDIGPNSAALDLAASINIVTVMRPELLTLLGDVGVENTVIDTETAILPRRVSNATAALASQLILSPGWGSAAPKTVKAGSDDTCVVFTITSAGSGQSPNPFVSFFYSRPFPKAPHIMAHRRGGDDLRSAIFNVAEANDHCKFSVDVTPTTGRTYTFVVSFR